jgi:hypothetical protein
MINRASSIEPRYSGHHETETNLDLGNGHGACPLFLRLIPYIGG